MTRITALLAALVLLFAAGTSLAQEMVFESVSLSPWVQARGSFLEPNRFEVAKDVSRTRLRLEMGYGGDLFKIKDFSFGGEGLVWSGLKYYSDFRFPVETADYFFGIYSVFPLGVSYRGERLPLRIRLSHISSHLVDGSKDQVVGGSSSHYSREFISAETQIMPHKEGDWFAISGGIKYVFHQITHVEPELQVPVTIDIIPIFRPHSSYLFATLSTAGSPSFPQYSADLTLRINTLHQTYLDLYGEYHYGASRYGIEGNYKESGYEFGVRVSALPFKVTEE